MGRDLEPAPPWLSNAWLALYSLIAAILVVLIFSLWAAWPYTAYVMQKFQTFESFGTEYHIRVRLEDGNEIGVYLHKDDYDCVHIGDRIILEKTNLRFAKLDDIDLKYRHDLEDGK